MATIDCKYCFLDELPEYWEGIWDKDDFVPHRTVDPDQKSDTQQEYPLPLPTRFPHQTHSLHRGMG